MVFIHKTAIVEKGVKLGDGVKVWAWCHLMPGVEVGKNTSIGERTFLGSGVKVGEGCRIQNGVFAPEGVALRDQVFIGPNVTFTNVKRPTAEGGGYFEPTTVWDRAVIGANATIICGIDIAQDAFVAAGAVVTKDVLVGETVKGVPAK